METDKILLIAPTELTAEEVSRPLSVIVGLFDKQSSEYFKRDLWEMLKAVVRDTSWTYSNDPSIALSLEKDFGRLIDTLWLMLDEKEMQEGQIELPEPCKIPEEQRLSDRMESANLYPILSLYRGRVRRLTMAEIENPYLAIKSFFQYQSREEWKESLAQWKEYALTNLNLAESYPDDGFIVEYELLEKMIEVAFLLNKQSESTFYDADDLYLDGLINDFNNRDKTQVTKNMLKGFFELLHVLPPERFCRNLRKTTLELLQGNIHQLPKDFGDYLGDLNRLAEFLDIAADELKPSR